MEKELYNSAEIEIYYLDFDVISTSKNYDDDELPFVPAH